MTKRLTTGVYTEELTTEKGSRHGEKEFTLRTAEVIYEVS